MSAEVVMLARAHVEALSAVKPWFCMPRTPQPTRTPTSARTSTAIMARHSPALFALCAALSLLVATPARGGTVKIKLYVRELLGVVRLD